MKGVTINDFHILWTVFMCRNPSWSIAKHKFRRMDWWRCLAVKLMADILAYFMYRTILSNESWVMLLMVPFREYDLSSEVQCLRRVFSCCDFVQATTRGDEQGKVYVCRKTEWFLFFLMFLIPRVRTDPQIFQIAEGWLWVGTPLRLGKQNCRNFIHNLACCLSTRKDKAEGLWFDFFFVRYWNFGNKFHLQFTVVEIWAVTGKNYVDLRWESFLIDRVYRL